MNKKLTVLVLTGALACSMALPAMAAQTAAVPISAPVSTEAAVSLPGSVLYYGTVQEIVKDAEGNITQLWMTSDRYGEYVMNIAAQTVWIDSGRKEASDPATIQEGEQIYVFHSTVETRSLPPQSAAFAVVRNIPMDARCAQYHEVEAVSLENDHLTITTDNGNLYLMADQDTALSFYDSDKAATLEDIRAGSYVMAWYSTVAASEPGQAHATHLMLLPSETQAQDAVLTRGELAIMLYEQAGKPSTDVSTDYTDVADDAAYAEAVRWVSGEGYMGGYGNGAFGPEDAVSREQLVTVLWRHVGSPMLMDYPGLTQFDDVGEISHFAQSAFAWAHQKGYIAAVEDGKLAPQSAADQELAEAIFKEVAARK